MRYGNAYLTRAQVPEILGPFAGYEKNVEPFLEAIKEHCQAAVSLNWEGVQPDHRSAQKKPCSTLTRLKPL